MHILVTYHGFNTIADLMRDVRGNKVIEKVYFPVTAPVENHARLLHYIFMNMMIYTLLRIVVKKN